MAAVPASTVPAPSLINILRGIAAAAAGVDSRGEGSIMYGSFREISRRTHTLCLFFQL
jgi:hypothetical protein